MTNPWLHHYSPLVDAVLDRPEVADVLDDQAEAALLALAVLDQAGYSAERLDRVADVLHVERLQGRQGAEPMSDSHCPFCNQRFNACSECRRLWVSDWETIHGGSIVLRYGSPSGARRAKNTKEKTA